MLFKTIFYIYILADDSRNYFVSGLSTNLEETLEFYNQKGVSPLSFAARKNIKNLVYYEIHESMNRARLRDDFIKSMSKEEKIYLIKLTNPCFEVLELQHK